MYPVGAEPELFLGRGYTGHEHLPRFGLLNMNARLYDPVNGRMLSPDKYVPAPFGTQGYNRYSYANNNPLVYVDQDGNFAFIPILIAAGIGALTSGATYSLAALANGNWNAGAFFKSMAFGAVSGAIGGGIAQIGGALAQNLGFNIISNVTAQTATNLIFGNEITFGSLAGAVAGGVVASRFGNFSGVKGGSLANIGAEVGFNALKYGVSGAVGGAVGAAIDGRDVGRGAVNGAVNGAIGGVAISGLNVLSMGPSYKPDREFGKFGQYKPVYRTGTFLTRRIFGEGSGVALGRNLVTHLAKEGGILSNYLSSPNDLRDFNLSLQAHETGHYQEQISLGFGEMYRMTLSQYAKWGRIATYNIPGTLEYRANLFSLYELGYYFTSDGMSIIRVSR